MDNTGDHLMLLEQQQLQGNSFLFVSNHHQQTGGGKRTGVPPVSPYSQLSPPLPSAGLHSRSRSHPALFSLESPPAVSPSDSVSADVSMDDHDAPISLSTPLPRMNAAPARDGLPPRTSHRRSQSDVPFAFFLPPVPPLQAAGFLDSAKPATAGGVKAEESQWDRGLNHYSNAGDDLFNAYMNLQGFDALTSSEENHSRDSGGSKTNAADSSENEADSNLGTLNALSKEAMAQSAAAASTGDSAANSRRCRSLSMDSFAGKFNFGEEPKKLQFSKSNSLDGEPSTFSLEFGNGQFSAVEMKKIMENEKLVEMAMADPKRVKRILANRQSAARSKERKMRYISELEHRVQVLQSETTTLSAQLNLMQRDTDGLLNQNNELKFRLQAMEQQAQLRDALNEALNAEVQRLKLSLSGVADGRHSSESNNHQTSINSQMFQLQQKQQPPQMPLYKQNDNTSD